MPLLSPAERSRLDALDLASRKLLRGGLQGERRAKQKGQSVEFADFRPYTIGDDLRRIDWNLYARLDKLILRLFLEEQDLSLTVLIDVSPSMAAGDPPKLRTSPSGPPRRWATSPSSGATAWPCTASTTG